MNPSSKQFLVKQFPIFTNYKIEPRCFNSDGSVAPDSFWTSATDLGCSGSFAWCAVRKMFYNSKWIADQPAKSTETQCVAVKLNAQMAQLEATNCAGAKQFICEVRPSSQLIKLSKMSGQKGSGHKKLDNRWQSSAIGVRRNIQHFHGFATF
jgi:hypothetical protein